ncbi:MAG: Porin precursor, partial [Verrucomicrobiota bacterium]
LDLGAGLAGAGKGGESAHGLVLGSVGWTQADAESRALAWSAYASVLWTEGRGPTERFLGDFLAVSNSEAYQHARMYEWWTEATRGEWSVRAGALLADAEFAGTTPGGALINSGFGWPAFLSANTVNTGPAFYAAALGTRLAYEGETTTWKLGVYDGDSFDSAAGDDRPNRHGLSYELGGRQGAFVISELNFAPGESANRYQVGAWAHTAEFTEFASGGTRSGNWGVYAALERTLAGKTGEAGNVEAHLRAGWAPEDRNTVAWAVDSAVAATGLFAARPADVTALGVVHARLSDDLGLGSAYEQTFELSHTFVVNEYISIQPDLQLVRHPGADRARDDALIALLRFSAVY